MSNKKAVLLQYILAGSISLVVLLLIGCKHPTSPTITTELHPPTTCCPSSGSTIYTTKPLLKWEDVQNAGGYHFQLSKNNSFTGPIVEENTTVLLVCQYPVANPLAKNITYYWRVRVQSLEGRWSDWSDTWSFTVKIAPFSIVWPTSGSTVNDTNPLLVWVNLPFAALYHIQLSMNNTFTGPMIEDNNTVAASQYQVTTILSENTTYYWHLRMQSPEGMWSDWSDAWSFTIGITPFTIVSPSNGSSITDTTPLLDWKDMPDAAMYHVQVNTNNSFTGTMIEDNSALTVSQYQVTTTLSDNSTYYWRVKFQNPGGGWGDWSGIWSYTVDVAPPVTTSPSSGSTIYDTTPLLNWEDVSEATGYHMQVSTNASFTGTMVSEDSALTSSQYQVTATLSDNTTYYWRVKVKNTDDVWGDWSSTWSYSVDISSPTSPSPANGSATSDTTPLLDWEDVADAAGYHVQVNTDSGFAGTMVVDSDSIAISEYQVMTTLLDNTTYYWHVKVKNADGVWGDWSGTWSYTVDIIPPGTPSPSSGSTIYDITPFLDWEDESDAAGYHVQVNTNSGFMGTMVVDNSAVSASQYQVITLLSDNTTYYWHVKVKNTDSVWGDWSGTWSFRVQAVTELKVGEAHSIILCSDGSLWAWGFNQYGGLGNGTTTDRATPGRVLGVADVIATSAGGCHSLAVSSDGLTTSWGYNLFGQLGDGTTTDRYMPVTVINITAPIAISGGRTDSFAITSDGTLWAWGENYYGQLGDSTTTNRSTAVKVQNLTGAIAVAPGYNHTIAALSDGKVWAWGRNNYGQIGDGSTTNSLLPVQVVGLSQVIMVAAGWSHSVALRNDGIIWAWGNNEYGQLGDGSKTNSKSPIQVSALSNIVKISAGERHTLVLRGDGTVWAWGDNQYGQLGDGTQIEKTSPVQVGSLANVTMIACGRFYSVAVTSDGSIWAWGQNNSGQLGDGTLIDKSTPTAVKW